MDNYVTIEQLHFNYDVNTVSSEKYPVTYPLHWHQHIECLAISKANSSALVSINQKLMTLNSGDILIIAPGELHEIIDNSSKSIIALQFPVSILSGKKEFAVYENIYKDTRYLAYSTSPNLNDNLLNDFDDILRLSPKFDDPFRNIKMTIMLYEIFMKIISFLKVDNSAYVQQADSDLISDKIQSACAYIKTNFDQSITLEDVAAYIGFSPCYFSRHFKKITTHSFVEYLTLQRISHLQVLLSDKSVSITQAAYQSGFHSISTLNRTFQKYCGCSPREYRQKYLP